MQPLAYRVPFAVDRSNAPLRFYLVNRSAETLESVRLCLLGSGLILPLSSRRLLPGGTIAFAASGAGLTRDAVRTREAVLARDAVVIVRWFRPNGEEYLWRISF